MSLVLLVVVLALTGWLFVLVNRVYRSTEAGPRVRRRLSQRMIFWVGVWQLAIAGFMIYVTDWTNAITLTGVGLAMMALAHWWRKVGMP